MDRDDEIENLRAQLLELKTASAITATKLAKSQANAAEMETQLQERMSDLSGLSKEVAKMREKARRFEMQVAQQKALLEATKSSFERSLDAQATLAGALAHCASGKRSADSKADTGFRLVASASILQDLNDEIRSLVLREDPSRARSSMAAALLASHIDRGSFALETIKDVVMKLDRRGDDADEARAAIVELGGCLHAAVRAMAATLPNMTPGQTAVAATPASAASSSKAEGEAVDWRKECLAQRASHEDLLVCLGRTQAALLRVQPRSGVHSGRSSVSGGSSEAASHSTASAAGRTEHAEATEATEASQAAATLFGFRFS
jgi:hypothetical protein